MGAEIEVSTHNAVLDALASRTEGAYLNILAEINSRIASELRRTHRVQKSDKEPMLFIGFNVGDEIIKAAKPKNPKAKPPKSPKAPKAGKKGAGPDGKRKEVESPGLHGGHYYFDDHGHVRYGVKPTKKFHVKATDDEVKNLFKKIEAVAGYDEDLDSYIEDKAGVPSDSLKASMDYSLMTGMSFEDGFKQLCLENEDEPMSEEDAEQAWRGILNTYQAALEDPALLKKVKNVMAKRKVKEKLAQQTIEQTTKFTKDFHGEFLTGNPEEVALKTIALLKDYGALILPESKREGSEEEIGNLLTDNYQVARLTPYMNELNPGQAFAMAVMDRLDAAMAAEDENDPDVGFKTPSGFSTAIHPDFDTDGVLKQALGHAPTKAEKDQFLKRVNETGSQVFNVIKDYNSLKGGEAVGMLFRDEIPTEQLFKSKSILQELRNKIAERKKIIGDALKARDDDSFATPEEMKEAFKRITLEARKRGEIGPNDNIDLFDYQRKIINWMTTIKGGIVAADTGLGKTPMLIAAIAYLLYTKKAKRGVLVMPKGLVKQWPAEIKRFFPNAQIVTLGEGMSMDDRLDTIEAINSGKMKADFVVMSSSTVDFHPDSRKALEESGVVERKVGKGGKEQWVRKEDVSQEEYDHVMADIRSNDKLAVALRSLEGAVAFDEAHHAQQGLTNPSNMHHQIAKEFLKGREYKWGLTATPMPNGHPRQLYNLMNLFNPGSAGESERKFTNMVATWEEKWDDKTGTMKRSIKDFSDWAEMNELIKPYVYRKNKNEKDVVESQAKMGIKLKPPRTQKIVMEMDKELAAAYAKAGTFVPHHMKGDPTYKMWDELGPKAKRMRALDQAAKMSVTPKLIFGDEWKGPQPKIDMATDLVRKHFESPANEDRPVVIFSAYSSAFKYMKEELIKKGVDPSLIGEIHNEIGQDERDFVQDAANAGKLKVILVGVGAGGAGLNLQKKANKIIFLDKPWSPALVDQAVGRVHRTGQMDTVDVMHLHVQGMLDEEKLRNLDKKIRTTTAAIESTLGEEFVNGSTIEALNKLLGETSGMQKMSGDGNGGEEILDSPAIKARLKALGLDNVRTSAALKQKFNRDKYMHTVEFKQWKTFGDQQITQAQKLNDIRFEMGKIDEDTYERRKRQYARSQLAWESIAKNIGDKDIMKPKGKKGPKDNQPKQPFVVVAKKNPFESGTPQHEVVEAMQNEGVRTPDDLVDEVIMPKVLKEVDPDLADEEHLRDKLMSNAKTIFDDLQRRGIIAARTGSGKNAEVPKRVSEEKPQKGAKGGKGSSKAPAKGRAAAPKEAPKPKKGEFQLLGNKGMHPQEKQFYNMLVKRKATTIAHIKETMAAYLKKLDGKAPSKSDVESMTKTIMRAWKKDGYLEA